IQLHEQPLALGAREAVEIGRRVAALGGGEHPLDALRGRRGRRRPLVGWPASEIDRGAQQDQRDCERRPALQRFSSRKMLRSRSPAESTINFERSLGSVSAIASRYSRLAVKAGDCRYSASRLSNRAASPCARRIERSRSALPRSTIRWPAPCASAK